MVSNCKRGNQSLLSGALGVTRDSRYLVSLGLSQSVIHIKCDGLAPACATPPLAPGVTHTRADHTHTVARFRAHREGRSLPASPSAPALQHSGWLARSRAARPAHVARARARRRRRRLTTRRSGPRRLLRSGSRVHHSSGPAHRQRPLAFALSRRHRGDALNLAIGNGAATGVTERAERRRREPSTAGEGPAAGSGAERRRKEPSPPEGDERAGRWAGPSPRHGGRGGRCGRRRGCRRPPGQGQLAAVQVPRGGLEPAAQLVAVAGRRAPSLPVVQGIPGRGVAPTAAGGAEGGPREVGGRGHPLQRLGRGHGQARVLRHSACPRAQGGGADWDRAGAAARGLSALCCPWVCAAEASATCSSAARCQTTCPALARSPGKCCCGSTGPSFR